MKSESEQYINKARSVSRELFDVTDYEVANAFVLIGYYFFGSGDKNKVSFHEEGLLVRETVVVVAVLVAIPIPLLVCFSPVHSSH
jgi:hypothetical protein